MEIIDVVKKLTGKIQPVGDSNEDAKRFENLLQTCCLIDQLLTEIHRISILKSDCRGSMKKAGKYADEFLKDIKDSIN